MSCARTVAEGGICEDNIAPMAVASTAWSLTLEATESGGGPRLGLNAPPPAGAEVVLECLVGVRAGAEAAPAEADSPARHDGPRGPGR